MLIAFGGMLVIFFCSSLKTLVLSCLTVVVIFSFLLNNPAVIRLDWVYAVEIL